MRSAACCSLALSALLVFGLTSSGHADSYDRLTYFTFSGAVQVPGATLPAGTYQFKLANPTQGRNVGIVLSRAGNIAYAQFFMTPDLHRSSKAAHDALLVFHEVPSGVPPAVRGWFYEGDETGYLLQYSHKQLSTFSTVKTNAALPLAAGVALSNPADVSEPAIR